MKTRLFTPALAALILWAGAPEVRAQSTDLEAFAQELLRDSGAPGVAVGWHVDGQSDVAVAGVRARNTNAVISVQDLWHIGSNTKSMTATLVARLVAAGVVGWDDTIAQRLGGLDLHSGYDNVTLAMLLAHRGGLPANIGPFAARRLSGAADTRDLVADRRSYVQSALAKAPATPPGSAFGYSNAGYVTAAAMVEAATGQSWEDLIETWVFEPLDMESVGYGAPGNPETLSQPRGHGGFFPWSRKVVAPGPDGDNIPALGPAGTVHLNLQDHLRYLRAHLRQPLGFLAPEGWVKLHSDVARQGYALGWTVRADDALAHAGSNTFWFNIALVDHRRKVAIVLALNDGAMHRVQPAAEKVLADMLAVIDAR